MEKGGVGVGGTTIKLTGMAGRDSCSVLTVSEGRVTLWWAVPLWGQSFYRAHRYDGRRFWFGSYCFWEKRYFMVSSAAMRWKRGGGGGGTTIKLTGMAGRFLFGSYCFCGKGYSIEYIWALTWLRDCPDEGLFWKIMSKTLLLTL